MATLFPNADEFKILLSSASILCVVIYLKNEILSGIKEPWFWSKQPKKKWSSGSLEVGIGSNLPE